MPDCSTVGIIPFGDERGAYKDDRYEGRNIPFTSATFAAGRGETTWRDRM